ncbi:MAG: phosphoadenosine phosphosulfate reductase family protein [Planctomycetota bacterium]
MPLIRSHRLTSEDLAAWEEASRGDLLHAASLGPKIERAMDELERFVADGPCYVSVSWGKDSVVVADLAMRAGVHAPLVWVRTDPIANPECLPVRDAFLALHPGARYHEIRVEFDRYERGAAASGGFTLAAEMVGASRYVTGIRSDESNDRARRHRIWGHSSPGTCAPISLWSALDVFAYLALYDLPIAAVYAMTMGGRLSRERLRVSALMTQRGDGMGKRDWEERYFSDVRAQLERDP